MHSVPRWPVPGRDGQIRLQGLPSRQAAGSARPTGANQWCLRWFSCAWFRAACCATMAHSATRREWRNACHARWEPSARRTRRTEPASARPARLVHSATRLGCPRASCALPASTNRWPDRRRVSSAPLARVNSCWASSNAPTARSARMQPTQVVLTGEEDSACAWSHCLSFHLSLPCPLGTFAPINGTAECKPCPFGSFQSALGQSRCLQCGVGTANNVLAQQACSPCDSGVSLRYAIPMSSAGRAGAQFFANRSGLVTCLSCAEGSYSTKVARGLPEARSLLYSNLLARSLALLWVLSRAAAASPAGTLTPSGSRSANPAQVPSILDLVGLPLTLVVSRTILCRERLLDLR